MKTSVYRLKFCDMIAVKWEIRFVWDYAERLVNCLTSTAMKSVTTFIKFKSYSKRKYDL